jgi:hypothetical protein
MPTPDYALLCHAALVQDNLLSMLGAGIDRVDAPQLPMNVAFTFVGRVVWAEEELGAPHVLRVKVRHDDGEQLADMQIPVQPVRATGMHDGSIATQVCMPIPLLVRRAGRYVYELWVDGDLVRELELRIATTMPQL